MLRRLGVVVVLSAACASSPRAPTRATPISVALTVDDLPGYGDPALVPVRAQAAARIAEVLRAHHSPPVYGFVNAGVVSQTPEAMAVLTAWKAGGQRFGNHSWAHRNLDETPIAVAQDDVARSEPLLEALEPGGAAGWRVYRYPFLAEGKDPEQRRAMRRWLVDHGYRVAEVSVDGYDWAFAGAMARCEAKGDEAELARLRAELVDTYVAELLRMREACTRLVGHDIHHVVLLHLGRQTSTTLDALMTRFEALGVVWAPLDAALADPFYADDPDHPTSRGGTTPNRVAERLGAPLEPPAHELGLVERLEQRCR